MKNSLVLFVTGLLFMACLVSEVNAQSSTNANGPAKIKLTQEEKEERNKRTALASVEAINVHNVDSALKDAAPDIVNYGNGNIPPVKGIDQVKAGLRMFTAALPIEKAENLVAIADGEWVMVWGQWSGTWKEDMMGQKATGKPYKKREVEIFRFNDEGKITEHHSVQSIFEVARQIGMKVPGQ